MNYYIGVKQNKSINVINITGECEHFVHGTFIETNKSFKTSKVNLTQQLKLKKVDLSLSPNFK